MRKIARFAIITLIALGIAITSACAVGQQTEQTINVDTDAVYESILEQIDMPEMFVLSEKRMLNYLGIAAEDCTQCVTAVCADNLRADEIWLVEAADEETANRIEELAKERLSRKSQENKDYLPEQYEVVQKAQLLRYGNYVVLFVSPDVDTMVNVFNDAAGIK